MDQRTANFTKWVDLVRFHIRIEGAAIDDGYLDELCTEHRDE